MNVLPYTRQKCTEVEFTNDVVYTKNMILILAYDIFDIFQRCLRVNVLYLRYRIRNLHFIKKNHKCANYLL